MLLEIFVIRVSLYVCIEYRSRLRFSPGSPYAHEFLPELEGASSVHESGITQSSCHTQDKFKSQHISLAWPR